MYVYIYIYIYIYTVFVVFYAPAVILAPPSIKYTRKCQKLTLIYAPPVSERVERLYYAVANYLLHRCF